MKSRNKFIFAAIAFTLGMVPLLLMPGREEVKEHVRAERSNGNGNVPSSPPVPPRDVPTHECPNLKKLRKRLVEDRQPDLHMLGSQSRWIVQAGVHQDQTLGYNHMSTLERFSNGSLVAAWQAAKTIEGEETQSIWYAFSIDTEGRHWGHPRMVPLNPAGALWSPVLHVDPASERLWLFYCESTECLRAGAGRAPPRFTPGGAVKASSTADGVHWAAPRELLSHQADGGVPKVLANKPTVLATGEWVLPMWREKPGKKNLLAEGGKCATGAMRQSAGVLLSADSGRTWAVHGNLTHSLTWLIESSVVQLRSSTVLMLFRTWVGQMFESRSQDRGRTWSAARPVSMPNPDSKTHAATVRDRAGEAVALAYNDHPKYHEDGWTRFRTHLRIALSLDDTEHWVRVAQVDDRIEYGWQYHYPTLLQVGCKLYMSYTKSWIDSEDDASRSLPRPLKGGIQITELDL